MTGTVGAPPGLSSPGPSPSNGANAEMDARQISAKIAQQVQTLLQQARVSSEQKVTAELKLLHNVMQEMDLRLDTLNKQLDEVPQASKESLEQAAVVAALAKVEQQWGKELGKLKGELQQTIFAHNHNADLMKHQKETLDRIRQEIDSRSAPHPEKVKAAQAQVATLEHVAEGMQKKKLDLLLQRVSALEAKLTSFWTGPGYATPAVPPAPATPPPAAPPAAAVPSAAPSAAPVRSGPPGLDVYAPANEGEDEDEDELQAVIGKALAAATRVGN
ncbi:unnamed protein product [Effrenium voratum]|uniref:Uncharacterized protein n=1 Tax=Effrenium voratum TaxID=2562239 RepID=A0AA36JAX5_9DINO|nr:unnamed protein product [Effrenium voratum]CAJ1402297.1 unnamed protein product [Effrenium voratum]